MDNCDNEILMGEKGKKGKVYLWKKLQTTIGGEATADSVNSIGLSDGIYCKGLTAHETANNCVSKEK